MCFMESWFNKQSRTVESLLGCAEECDCNFIHIGGIFELLDIASYSEAKTR